MVCKEIDLTDIDLEVMDAKHVERCISSIVRELFPSSHALGISVVSEDMGKRMVVLTGREETFASISDYFSVVSVVAGQKIKISNEARDKGICPDNVRFFLKAIAVPFSGSNDPLSYKLSSDDSILTVRCEEDLFAKMKYFLDKIKIQEQPRVKIQNNPVVATEV
ncbi:MAG: hypothetical protein PHX30_02875 [Candidatus Pacebacteria bacterium]|nr:hypothetical protein [Candidatus Paceibacterota bacterium]